MNLFVIFFSYITFTLDNGLKVYYEKIENTKVFTFLVVVNSGSFNENKGEEGLTHFLEHMLFDGNERFSRTELREHFKKLGLYVNAFTREDFTAYFFSGPDENFKEGIYLLYLMLLKSTLSEKEIEKEKGVVFQEMIQDRTKEYNIAREIADSLFFRKTPYAHPVIGFKETIENLNRDKLLKFYKKYYVPSNMVIFARGDIEEGLFKEIIKKSFGKEKSEKVKVQEELLFLEEYKGEKIKVYTDIKNFYMFIGIKTPPLTHPLAPYYIVLENLLDTEIGIDNLKRKEKNILNVSYSYEPRRKAGVFIFSFTVNSSDIENIEKSFVNFLHEFEKRLDNDIFRKTKRKIVIQKGFERKDPVYFIFYKTPYIAYGGPELEKRIYQRITDMDYGEFKEFLKKFISEFKNARKIYIYPESYKKAYIKKDFVESIHILVKNRLNFEPQGKRGLSQVFFRAILKGDIQKIVDSIGLQVKSYDNPFLPFDDYYHRRDFGYIRLSFLSSHRNVVIDVLKKILNPKFDSVNVELSKNEAIFAKNVAFRDPRVVAWHEFENRIFKGNMANSLYGIVNEIKNITLKDLKMYKTKAFKKENLIITYNSQGHLDKEIVNFINNISNNMEGNSILIRNIVFNDTVSIGSKQAYIIGGKFFDIEDIEEFKKFMALSLLLSERIKKVIREEMGFAYRLHAGVKLYPGKVLFYVEIGTSRESMDKVFEALEKEFDNLHKFINKKNLKIVANSFRGNMLRRLENPETRSFYEGYYIYNGFDKNEIQNIINELLYIDLKDLKKFFKERIDIKDFSFIFLI